MVNQSDEPLRKVTLNLFEEDVKWFEQNYDAGKVSEMLRQAVRDYVEDHYVRPPK